MLRSGFLLAALVATSAATLTAKPASAEARVKVPFSFTVNGKVCPAGMYRVKSDRENNSVTLIGRKSARTFSWIVVPTSSEEDPNRVVLQFDASGSDHALRSIQYGAQSTARLDTNQRESDEDNDAARGGR